MRSLARTVTASLILVALTTAVLGCGGGDKTAEAAKCLKNTINNQAVDPSLANDVGCSDSISKKYGDALKCGTSLVGSKPCEAQDVTCTHANANEYKCAVTAQAGGQKFYDVTFDGKSIQAQPTGP